MENPHPPAYVTEVTIEKGQGANEWRRKKKCAKNVVARCSGKICILLVSLCLLIECSPSSWFVIICLFSALPLDGFLPASGHLVNTLQTGMWQTRGEEREEDTSWSASSNSRIERSMILLKKRASFLSFKRTRAFDSSLSSPSPTWINSINGFDSVAPENIWSRGHKADSSSLQMTWQKFE